MHFGLECGVVAVECGRMLGTSRWGGVLNGRKDGLEDVMTERVQGCHSPQTGRDGFVATRAVEAADWR